ncbi:down syndrome cell adhesion molecule-like protein Dscam2 [Trichonephila clavipes]|nr:down syndrome cell adhesion molecule-like protein Dscam2 [Trichonephila clavipes]
MYLFTGEPPEKFKTIVSSSHVHILVNGSLNFQSIETSDSGFYLCEANNGVGTGLSTVVRLSVHSAPQFHSKYTMMTARKGERATMECRALGDKPMSFSWKKNGVSLDPVTELRYSQLSEDTPLGGQSSLIIEKVEKKDSALFTCSAVNDYGEDSKNLQLTIQDIPDAPQSTEVHDVSSRSVRLSWNKPFDGNSPITQYTVMWRQVGGQGTGGPLTVPGTETTLVIRGLKPKTRYFFRVKCENSLGESQFGAEVAVTTLEERHNVTVNGDRYTAIITNFFIPELNNHDVQELWFQQLGATCHTVRATIYLLKDTFGDRLNSRFRPVNWPSRSCDLTPLDYFLWDYVKSLVYEDTLQTLDHLEDNIRRVIANIRPQMLEKVIENWSSRLDYIRASRGSPMPEIIFKM